MRPRVAKTTINDSGDFRIGKRLTNLPALREMGFSANRRLLGVQRLSHNPIRAAEAFTAVHEPIITSTGQRVAGLRLATPRPRTPAGPAGLPAAHPDRVQQPRPTRAARRAARHTPREITAGQAGYDLRRLRVHGLIARIPGTHRYRLTHIGGDHAMLLTRIHTRLLHPGLAQLTDPDPPMPCHLRTAATPTGRSSINSPNRPDSPHENLTRSSDFVGPSFASPVPGLRPERVAPSGQHYAPVRLHQRIGSLEPGVPLAALWSPVGRRGICEHHASRRLVLSLLLTVREVSALWSGRTRCLHPSPALAPVCNSAARIDNILSIPRRKRLGRPAIPHFTNQALGQTRRDSRGPSARPPAIPTRG